jgi:molybdenum cofactor cytidylyltransferase
VTDDDLAPRGRHTAGRESFGAPSGIALLLLAAGLARRMGQPKVFLELDGRPLLLHALDRLLDPAIADAVVVVGPGDLARTTDLLGGRARAVVNPAPEQGQSSSLRVGVDALAPGTEAVVIALGDQPTVSPAVVPGLIRRWRESGRPVVAPRYTDGRGNPVLFAAAVLPELRAVSGDQGARAVIARDPGRVAVLELDEPMPPDVDTPEDLARLRAGR